MASAGARRSRAPTPATTPASCSTSPSSWPASARITEARLLAGARARGVEDQLLHGEFGIEADIDASGLELSASPALGFADVREDLGRVRRLRQPEDRG